MFQNEENFNYNVQFLGIFKIEKKYLVAIIAKSMSVFNFFGNEK